MDFIRENGKSILIFGAILIVAFIAYSYLFKGSDNGKTLVQSSPTAADGGEVVGGDLLAVLNNLQAINLDDAVFNDPIFQHLRNFRVEIPPEPIGRPNPFAPIDNIFRTPSTSTIKVNTFKTN